MGHFSPSGPYLHPRFQWLPAHPHRTALPRMKSFSKKTPLGRRLQCERRLGVPADPHPRTIVQRGPMQGGVVWWWLRLHSPPDSHATLQHGQTTDIWCCSHFGIKSGLVYWERWVIHNNDAQWVDGKDGMINVTNSCYKLATWYERILVTSKSWRSL